MRSAPSSLPSASSRASRELLAAAQEGNEPLARACVERGADPSFSDDAAFAACAQKGHESLARFLLDARPAAKEINWREGGLSQAARTALKEGRPAFFFMLAERDRRFTAIDHFDALAPLAKKSRLEAFKAALDFKPAPDSVLRDLTHAAFANSHSLAACFGCVDVLLARGATPWQPSQTFSGRGDAPPVLVETLRMACSRQGTAAERAEAGKLAVKMIARAQRENQYGLVCALKLHLADDYQWVQPPVELTKRLLDQLRKTGARMDELLEETAVSCVNNYSMPAARLLARLGGDNVARRAMRASISKGSGPSLICAMLDDGVPVDTQLRAELRAGLDKERSEGTHSPENAAALRERLLALDERDELLAQISPAPSIPSPSARASKPRAAAAATVGAAAPSAPEPASGQASPAAQSATPPAVAKAKSKSSKRL